MLAFHSLFFFFLLKPDSLLGLKRCELPGFHGHLYVAEMVLKGEEDLLSSHIHCPIKQLIIFCEKLSMFNCVTVRRFIYPGNYSLCKPCIKRTSSKIRCSRVNPFATSVRREQLEAVQRWPRTEMESKYVFLIPRMKPWLWRSRSSERLRCNLRQC